KKVRPPSIVFVVDGKKVVKTEVKTGLSDKGYIEIKSGIEEGQEVVSGSFMAVSKKLYDGATIKVKKKKKKRRFGKKEE
nr:efflux transporter periplasmic adaptor subunit [Candidatus Kapabacteria bacterium]